MPTPKKFLCSPSRRVWSRRQSPCATRSAISGTISSALNFAGYRLELSNLAIHNPARIFKLEGFKNTTLSSIIREPLWPTSHSAEAGLLKRAAIRIGVFTGFTTLYTLIGVALETVFPSAPY